MSGPDSLRRRPFATADADAVVDFCARHGRIHDRALLRSLLLDLTSDPTGVILLEEGDGVALIASVVDRLRNGADAANLETLGIRVAPTAEAFIRLVVEPAVTFARAGERRALQIPLPVALARAAGIDDALAAGFAWAYDYFDMRRPETAPPPASPEALPTDWSWATVDHARVDGAHAALAEMFRDVPSTSAKPLADFRQAVVSGAAMWRALLDGDRIAGLVRVALHGAHGEIRVLGRVPAYRGRGLGPRLLGEGLRRLYAMGAGDVELTVEAANERALDLYRRFAFEVVERTPVFMRRLRG